MVCVHVAALVSFLIENIAFEPPSENNPLDHTSTEGGRESKDSYFQKLHAVRRFLLGK